MKEILALAFCFGLFGWLAWLTPRRPRGVGRFLAVYLVLIACALAKSVFDHDWFWVLANAACGLTLFSWWADCRQKTLAQQVNAMDPT